MILDPIEIVIQQWLMSSYDTCRKARFGVETLNVWLCGSRLGQSVALIATQWRSHVPLQFWTRLLPLKWGEIGVTERNTRSENEKHRHAGQFCSLNGFSSTHGLFDFALCPLLQGFTIIFPMKINRNWD